MRSPARSRAESSVFSPNLTTEKLEGSRAGRELRLHSGHSGYTGKESRSCCKEGCRRSKKAEAERALADEKIEAKWALKERKLALEKNIMGS